ncbi:hypothetical protein BDR06DRAFT_1002928 [Suillus hirtellus]|nr:hypothetical protein BDR06DRAFT_1002928 [Suillus hirtellus]
MANTIQKAVTGDGILDNDIDDDVEESDDNIEVLNGPPAGSTFHSHASGSSRKSASVASTVLDKMATCKKIIRTYGSKKQQAHNLKTTGDDEGKIFDRSSIVVDDDGSQPEPDKQDDGATATSSPGPCKNKGKQKAMGKAKAKGVEKKRVVKEDINMFDEEDGMPKPPQPKPKPKLKAKGKDMVVKDDIEMDDEEGTFEPPWSKLKLKLKAKEKDKAVDDDIEIDNQEDGTSEPPQPKQKPKLKAKGKDKAVADNIDMDDNEKDTSAPPPPKQKPRPKPRVKGAEMGKSKALMSATERIMQDEQKTLSHGVKPGPANHAAVAVPSGDEDDDSQIQPRSSRTTVISSTTQRDESDVEDDKAGAHINLNLTRWPVMPDVDNDFTLDDGDTTGPCVGTQNSAQDKSDVEALLGEKQMSDLTLTERNDDQVQSSQLWDDQRFTDTYSGGQKHCCSTTSTVASPPSGPQRSPNCPRPPHKKVHVHGDGSAAVWPSQSLQNEGAGSSILFNDWAAIPENAPKPRGMRGWRGRGGIARARS